VRVYLDAPPVIYYVERVPDFFSAAGAWLDGGGNDLVASDLTRMECRIAPVRNDNHILLAGFDTFFGEIVTDIVTLSRLVVDRATAIRAEYAFRTPDSIHLAAAVESQCEVFLTNDLRLRRFRDVAVEALRPQ
jgi:predicted nucleic acid-binding protein